jgi:hypothetical protein
VFGRRKRQAAEAVREAERRALFERLAERPETVCPFLGLAAARAEYRDGFTGEHRCYAFGDPAPISEEQQEHVCLERGYSNCPRYLRGVLVIPSEELEALRRPLPAHVPPPPAPPKPVRPAAEGGGRRWVVVGVLALLLIAASGAGGWYLYLQNRGVATGPSPTGTATPLASLSTATVPAPTGSKAATPTPEPTPAPGDRFAFYEVGVAAGTTYTLYSVDPQSGPTNSRVATFSRQSRAPVVPNRTANGLVYWQTTAGGYLGWSYLPGQSGPFQLREVFLTSDGERRVQLIEADRETVLPVATPSPRP